MANLCMGMPIVYLSVIIIIIFTTYDTNFAVEYDMLPIPIRYGVSSISPALL